MQIRPAAAISSLLVSGWLAHAACAQVVRPGTPSRTASPPVSTGAAAQPIATIAVLPFENLKKDAQYDWLGIGAADTLTTKLAAVDALIVVERSQIQKVLQEQDFHKLDVTDPASVVRVGKLLAAQRIVIGTYATQSEQVLFNVRVVDVESSEVLSTASLTGRLDRIFDTLYELADAVIRSFDKRVQIVDSRPVVANAAPQERLVLDDRQKAAVRDEGRTTMPAFEAYSRGILAVEPAESVRYFSLAINLDSGFSLAYLNRGDVYCRQGRYELAVADYDRTVQLNPRRVDVYYRKGDVYERAGRPRMAAVAYRKYVQVAPPQQARKVEKVRGLLRGIKEGKRAANRDDR